MKETRRTNLGMALVFAAIVLIAAGILAREHLVVLNKAINICLECIGIG